MAIHFHYKFLAQAKETTTHSKIENDEKKTSIHLFVMASGTKAR